MPHHQARTQRHLGAVLFQRDNRPGTMRIQGYSAAVGRGRDLAPSVTIQRRGGRRPPS